MPENKAQDKDTGGRSLSDVQLDDFDVDRQRERLEHSRLDNMQSDAQEHRQQPGEANRQQGKP